MTNTVVNKSIDHPKLLSTFFFYLKIDVKIKFPSHPCLRADKRIAWHVDASSVLCILSDNGKFTNQIVSLLPIVVKLLGDLQITSILSNCHFVPLCLQMSCTLSSRRHVRVSCKRCWCKSVMYTSYLSYVFCSRFTLTALNKYAKDCFGLSWSPLPYNFGFWPKLHLCRDNHLLFELQFEDEAKRKNGFWI